MRRSVKLLEETQLQPPSEDVQSCLTGNHLFVRRWNDFCPEDVFVTTKGNIGDVRHFLYPTIARLLVRRLSHVSPDPLLSE